MSLEAPPDDLAEVSTARVAALITRLASEGQNVSDPRELIREVAAALRALGVPVDRCMVGLQVLHPQVRVVSWSWRHGVDDVVEREFDYSLEEQPIYLSSPIVELRKGTPLIRRRLVGPDARLDYPILHDLVADGFTDYVALSFRVEQGPGNAVTWATQAPGGFTPDQVEALQAMLPVLSLLLEVHAQRRISRALLGTYLGQDAGRRVLSGQVRRGDGERIRAVIWCSDMRDFTQLSDSMPGPALLTMLNTCFERQVWAIHRNGGEVLKFIGDGLLAIFRIDDREGVEAEASRRAVVAGVEAFASLQEENLRRVGQGLLPIRVGLALHIGDVEFGNIGAPDRLDFTVIGPAVNLAARLESLSKILGEPFLLSSAVAQALAGASLPVRPLGPQAIRGLPVPQPVFAVRL
ncbi:adenylate/guanylate cyclase domain-containing protein [Myxococcota bacterium]|nr:adenylate/guanylate cyclase domain-containing protein [Myxococcota bacterium]